jgi:hypothetical protein
MKNILNSLFQTFLNSSAASIHSCALGAIYSYKYFFCYYIYTQLAEDGSRYVRKYEKQPISLCLITGSFPWVKQLRRGVDHPPPFSTEVKERVEIYLYSPSGSSWPVLGRSLPLPFPYYRFNIPG